MFETLWTNELDLARPASISNIKITTDEALSKWRKQANYGTRLHIAVIGETPMKSLLANKNRRHGELIIGACHGCAATAHTTVRQFGVTTRCSFVRSWGLS